MPEIVSDEFREGYAALLNDVYTNPYQTDGETQPWIDWEQGYMRAFEDWCELMGAN